MLRALAATILLLSVIATGSTSAQNFPNRPITLLVPFAPGGPTDVLARILAERMRVSLGQPIIIENVTGAGGTISVNRTARASPDGYTISIGNWSTHVLNGATYSLQIDLLNDLAPIALLANNSELVVSRRGFPANNLEELITWMKRNPDKATAGSGGGGSHVAAALFQNLTGTKFHIAFYRGAAPVMQDLVAEQIDLFFDQASSALPHVRSGNIKAFAVTANSRLPSAPEIPTVDEAGLPGFYISIWHALWAPKGTPREVLNLINAAAEKLWRTKVFDGAWPTLGKNSRLLISSPPRRLLLSIEMRLRNGGRSSKALTSRPINIQIHAGQRVKLVSARLRNEISLGF